jgi:hypothetical protein
MTLEKKQQSFGCVPSFPLSFCFTVFLSFPVTFAILTEAVVFLDGWEEQLPPTPVQGKQMRVTLKCLLKSNKK